MLTEIEYDPVAAFQRLRRFRGVTFLDSARLHPSHGRFSLLAADPFLILSARGSRVTLEGGTGIVREGNPWEILRETLARFAQPEEKDREGRFLPRGMAAGYFGYNLGWWLDRCPRERPPPLSAPDLWFGFYDTLLVFDHLDQKGWILSTGLDAGGGRGDAGRARHREEEFLEALRGGEVFSVTTRPASGSARPLSSREDHERAIRRALEYIRRGDIYQVNLAHAFAGKLDESPTQTYLRLRQSNPAPFGGFLDFGSGQLMSSSPERFLRMRGRSIETRPIKGTRPRTGDPEIDDRETRALLRSPKDRAELLMITDLLRNDLGRVAEFGSVEVEDLACCEEYETVLHLVSTVKARLRSGVAPLDALAACFPGGSITGAPKLRAMEIIRELEPCGRGVYTGSLGYFGFNGVSDFNILIRTLLRQGDEVCFHAGGGIVTDSDPALEYEETIHKARGLLRLWTDQGG